MKFYYIFLPLFITNVHSQSSSSLTYINPGYALLLTTLICQLTDTFAWKTSKKYRNKWQKDWASWWAQENDNSTQARTREGPPNPNGPSVPAKPGTFRSGSIRSYMKTSVQQECKNNDCKTQSSIYIETKNSLMKTAQVFEKKFFNNDAKVDIDRQFSAIWDYKKALIDKAGLSQYVSPADNGLVDGDVLLSEQQARFLINELQKRNFDGHWKNLPLPDLNRDKRSALFFGENNQFIQKWDTSQPILYMFDETYDEYEKNSVRQAHRLISSAASCIHFQFDPIAYKKGHFIYYTRTITSAVCGLSHVGRQPKGNVIQINFESCEKLAQTGVIVHETLHALGIEHTHQRVDRDDFIEIVWNRINPQLIDTFVHADNNIYSTYGVQYDFDSIMQYKWNMGSKIPNKETMRPKIAYTQNRARMGQRNHLSPSDIEILNKLYCWTGCRDLKVMCGRWAMLGLCSDAKYKTFMKNRCKLSCGYCGGTRYY